MSHAFFNARRATWILALLLACAEPPAPSGASEPVDHADWDRQLRTWVDAAGGIAYRDWFAQDFEALQTYIEQLGAADPSSWPEDEQLAFVRLSREQPPKTPIPKPTPTPNEIGLSDLSGKAIKGLL